MLDNRTAPSLSPILDYSLFSQVAGVAALAAPTFLQSYNSKLVWRSSTKLSLPVDNWFSYAVPKFQRKCFSRFLRKWRKCDVIIFIKSPYVWFVITQRQGCARLRFFGLTRLWPMRQSRWFNSDSTHHFTFLDWLNSDSTLIPNLATWLNSDSTHLSQSWVESDSRFITF